MAPQEAITQLQQSGIPYSAAENALNGANTLQRGDKGNALFVVYPENAAQLQKIIGVLNDAEARAFFGAEAVESCELIAAAALNNLRESSGKIPINEQQLTAAPYYVILKAVSAQPEAKHDLQAQLVNFMTEVRDMSGEAPLFPDAAGVIYNEKIPTPPNPPDNVLAIRKTVPQVNTAMWKKRAGGGNDYQRVTPDMAIPAKQAGAFMQEVHALIREMFPGGGIEIPVFGHLDMMVAQHLHIQGPMGEKREAFEQRLGDIIVHTFNGTRWAEHGVGQTGAKEWLRLMPKDIIDQHFAIKLENDPNNTLNPKSFGMDIVLRALADSPERQQEMHTLCKHLNFKNAARWIEEKYLTPPIAFTPENGAAAHTAKHIAIG